MPHIAGNPTAGHLPAFDTAVFRDFTADMMSPAQQFMGFATRGTAPGSRERDALFALQNPLLQQYYLGGTFGPAAGQDRMFSGTGGWGSNFSDFMRGTGVTPQGYTGQIGTGRNLRDLAGDVGYITQLTEGEGPGSFQDYLGNLPANISPEQAASYRNIYQAGENARQNQFGLAQLLATQRPGGGIYGGLVGQALNQILSDLYATYTTSNPQGNFLNYFLERTGAGPQANFGLASLMGA